MRGSRLLKWACVVFVVFVVGCSEDPCEEVAKALRACCEKGPAELKGACEERAAGLENDGNAEACDEALKRGDFAGCGT